MLCCFSLVGNREPVSCFFRPAATVEFFPIIFFRLGRRFGVRGGRPVGVLFVYMAWQEFVGKIIYLYFINMCDVWRRDIIYACLLS